MREIYAGSRATNLSLDGAGHQSPRWARHQFLPMPSAQQNQETLLGKLLGRYEEELLSEIDPNSGRLSQALDPRSAVSHYVYMGKLRQGTKGFQRDEATHNDAVH